MKQLLTLITLVIILMSCSSIQTEPNYSNTIKGEVTYNGKAIKAQVSLYKNSNKSFRVASSSDSAILDEIAFTETNQNGEYTFNQITLSDGDTLSISAACLGGSSTGTTTIQATGESTISVKSIECNSSGIVNITFTDTNNVLIVNDIFRINGKEIKINSDGVYSSLNSDEYKFGDTLNIYPNDPHKYSNDTTTFILNDSNCTYISCDLSVEYDRTLLTITIPSLTPSNIKVDTWNFDDTPTSTGVITLIPISSTDSTATYELPIDRSIYYIFKGLLGNDYSYNIKLLPSDMSITTNIINTSVNPMIAYRYDTNSFTNWDLNINFTLDTTIIQ